MKKVNRPDFEINDEGKKRVILWRKKGTTTTDPCPFCGNKHEHGDGEGDRVPHCYAKMKRGREQKLPDGIFLSDGTWVDRKEGYVIRHYD